MVSRGWGTLGVRVTSATSPDVPRRGGQLASRRRCSGVDEALRGGPAFSGLCAGFGRLRKSRSRTPSLYSVPKASFFPLVASIVSAIFLIPLI